MSSVPSKSTVSLASAFNFAFPLFVFLLFVLPGITAILPSSLADSIMPYLPLSAGTTVVTSTYDLGSHHLSTWGGFALFCGYAAVAVAAAAIGLRRRDV